MLKYNGDRTKEVLMALNACKSFEAVRIYQTLEFLRDPFSSITHTLRLPQIAEHARVSRCNVYRALDELVGKGLIEVIKLEKRGLYRFRFLMLKAEVVKLDVEEEQSAHTYTPEELAEAKTRIPFG